MNTTTHGSNEETSGNNVETTSETTPETKKQSPIGEADLFPPLARGHSAPLAPQQRCATPWGFACLLGAHHSPPKGPCHSRRQQAMLYASYTLWQRAGLSSSAPTQ